MDLSTLGTNAYNAQTAISSDVFTRVERQMTAQNEGAVKLNTSLIKDQTKLSALGTLQSALADFQLIAKGMSGSGLATSSSSSVAGVLSATVSEKSVSGTYAVNVMQLAQAQVLNSSTQNAVDSTIGSGAKSVIKVEFGATQGKVFTPGDKSTTKTVTIDSSNNTLTGIASAFKAAGIDAKVVKSGSGFAISLNGQTGSANSMRISVTGDAAVKNLLTYNPSGKNAMSQYVGAQDALLTVNGTEYKSASNTVSSAIAGTTLALSSKGTTSVIVEKDASKIAGNVANLISAYNNLNAKLQTLQKGDLKSDTALGQASSQLTQMLKIGVNGASTSALAKVGISLGKNGDLKLDEKLLKNAIATDPDAVSKLFTNNGKGVADQFSAKISALNSDKGTIHKEITAVNKEIVALSSKKEALAKVLTAQASALFKLYSQQSQIDTTSSGTGMSLFDYM